MRVTLFGASGLLGKALMREWHQDAVTGLSSSDADIRDAGRVLQVVRDTRPEWIVLSAAYTDVDGCESNAELAFAVNRGGAVNVARAARAVGARLMFLSSDYVFDGQKTTPYETSDPRNPQSVYGRTKAEAEIRLLELIPAVLRCPNIVAVRSRRKMFPRHDSEAGGKPSNIGCRQRPTWFSDLCGRLGAIDYLLVSKKRRRDYPCNECG